jgi:type VI secretion system VasD/TssJ family lipoprotein
MFVKLSIVLSAMLSLVLFSACMMPPASPPQWKMEKGGITLNIKADSQLNTLNGKSYTLYFVVYQLINPNSFNQLCQNNDGLAKLLESKIYDSSVAAVKSMIVYPGSDVTYRVDRAEGAMYVGVVAGYNTMGKDHMVRLFDVPVFITKSSMFSLQRKLVPGPLSINLALGPQQIEDVKGKK